MKKFVVCLLGCAVVLGAEAQLINGAGSSFGYPAFTKWSEAYAAVDSAVHVNYRSVGSGAGQQLLVKETVDFGASDGPMSDDNLAKAPRTLWHFPTVAGADVITYNIPGDAKLKIDGATIAGIFLGKIVKWNDPAIAGQNPDLKLPDADIVVVHRSDGSGTTYIFTDYLSNVSADWKAKVGKGTSVSWPTGIGGKGNEGVSGQVKQVPGSIGYVELVYAKQNKLPYADVKNSSGNYVTPSIESVTEALAAADIPADFRFSMVNPPGATAYPIAGTTWLLVYAEQKDHAKGEKLVQFLKWAYSDGEKLAPALDYAPLPDALIKRALEKVQSIKY